MIVKDFFRQRHYLGSKDRRFISDATYGMLRNYRLLRVYAEEGMKKSEIAVSQVPSLGIYLSYALRIQNEEIQSVLPDVRGFWQISFPRVECETILNAIAQSTLPSDILDSPARKIALMHSFPDFIVDEWIERFGESETRQLCEAMNQPAPITIRVNTLKTTVEACQSRLAEEGVASKRTTLSPVGLVLSKRMNAHALRSFNDGLFEMQDEGSQLLSLLLEVQPGQMIVDACAGGGGKTLHIAALMNNEGELHSIDIDEKRLTNIRSRLDRAGVTISRLLHGERNNDNIALLNTTADAVFLDAPCSGVGTFRRNPATKLTVSEEYVNRMSTTQRSILDANSALVRPGGRLVYSTCTLLRKENENVVESFLSSHPEFTLCSAPDILKHQGVAVDAPSDSLTLLPHKTGTDGFFVAVMTRQP